MPEAQIGEGCSFGQGCFVGRAVRVGARVRVQNHVSLFEGTTVEDEVFIGPGAVFTNVRRPRAAFPAHGQYERTHIQRGATIGGGAVLVAPVVIGSWAMVGAGAVVTKDVAPHSLVIGNPARHVAWVSRRGHTLHFDDRGRARCPEDGSDYELGADGLVALPTPATAAPPPASER